MGLISLDGSDGISILIKQKILKGEKDHENDYFDMFANGGLSAMLVWCGNVVRRREASRHSDRTR